MKKIITSILFICFISWSCSKNNDTSISPNSQILREIKSINNIEIDNSLAEKFLTSDEFQILRKTTKESKIESIAFVEFKDSRLQGLINASCVVE